jgi:hypothetical protein
MRLLDEKLLQSPRVKKTGVKHSPHVPNAAIVLRYAGRLVLGEETESLRERIKIKRR